MVAAETTVLKKPTQHPNFIPSYGKDPTMVGPDPTKIGRELQILSKCFPPLNKPLTPSNFTVVKMTAKIPDAAPGIGSLKVFMYVLFEEQQPDRVAKVPDIFVRARSRGYVAKLLTQSFSQTCRGQNN